VNLRKTIAVTVLFFCDPLLFAQEKTAVPLLHGSAHRDQARQRPLLDSLDRGFCSIELDVHLIDGKLLVGHDRKDLNPVRTLQAVYFDPLRERVKKNDGRVNPGWPSLMLLLDFKTEGPETYAAVRRLLVEYAEMLTVVENGKITEKAVTVILSGNAPQAREAILADSPHYAALDGRIGDLPSDLPASLLPLISESWTTLFKWRGNGPMPEEEKAKLLDIVKKIHEKGRRLRLWSLPETVEFWTVLRAAGVDLLNADDIEAMQRFLLDDESPKGNGS
jgi:hypothetical protein